MSNEPTPKEACAIAFPDDKKKQKKCRPLMRTIIRAKKRIRFSPKLERAAERANEKLTKLFEK